MKKLCILLIAGATIFFYSCSSSPKQHHDEATGHDMEKHEGMSHDKHWAYEGKTAPEYWASVCGFSDCAGNHQSPIDISGAIDDGELVELEPEYAASSACSFVNNGHSIQVNFADTTHNVFMIDGKEFVLKQFHFHCPSEHTIAGSAYPSEAHMVHLTSDGEIAVIGILIEEGEENPFLASVLSVIPEKKDEKNKIKGTVNPSDLLPDDKAYYAYSGSLTTPPCSEGVNWFVLKTSIQASKEQIEAMRDAMPLNNARPVQALNDRKVKEFQ